MALPPFSPSDTAEIVPQPGDPACTVLSNMTQGLTILNQLAAYMFNQDKSLTQGFLDAIGASGTGLNAPTGVNATDDRTDDVTVTWNAVSDAVYYQVFRGTSSDTSTHESRADNVSGLSYADTGGTADVTYWYSVRAIASNRISNLSTPDAGVKRSETAPATFSQDFGGDATGVYSFTVPAGQPYATMELLLWGAGGYGGNYYSVPGTVYQGQTLVAHAGGGGAAGSHLRVTGITVAPGDVFYIRVGTRGTAASDGNTYVWKTSVNSAEYALATGGNNGSNGSLAGPGLGGTALSSSTGTGGWGTNSLVGGTIDTSGGDTSAAGPAGTDAALTVGGTGGAAIVRGSSSAGAGGRGVQTPDQTTQKGSDGFARILLYT